MLTNREIAVAIWLTIATAIALCKADIRRSFVAVLKAFCEPKIIVLSGLMVLYTAAVVLCLYTVNIWTVAVVKETVFWFAGAAVVAFSSVTSRTEGSVFSKTVADTLRLTVLVEFLVSNYTFSLPIELVFVPLVTFVMMLHGFAKSDERYSKVASFLSGIQILVGIVLITYVVAKAVSDYKNLLTLDTAREILVAPVMSVLFVPFVYSMLVFVSYDSLFSLLKAPYNAAPGVKRYARRRLLRHLRFSLKRIHLFHSSHGRDLIRVQSRTDVDNMLDNSTS